MIQNCLDGTESFHKKQEARVLLNEVKMKNGFMKLLKHGIPHDSEWKIWKILKTA